MAKRKQKSQEIAVEVIETKPTEIEPPKEPKQPRRITEIVIQRPLRKL